MSVEIAPRRVSGLLKELFGRNVKVDTTGQGPAAPETSWIAEYRAGQGKLAGACVCDLEFAANAGAALCMIPASTAKQSVSARKLDAVLLENVKEILNVCSQLFIELETKRVSLQSVVPASQVSADDLKQLMAAPKQRVDLQVSVEGYGDGKLSFLT